MGCSEGRKPSGETDQMEPREIQAAQSSPARQDDLSLAQQGTCALKGLQGWRVPPTFSGLTVRRCLLKLNCQSCCHGSPFFRILSSVERTAASRPPKNKALQQLEA